MSTWSTVRDVEPTCSRGSVPSPQPSGNDGRRKTSQRSKQSPTNEIVQEMRVRPRNVKRMSLLVELTLWGNVEFETKKSVSKPDEMKR